MVGAVRACVTINNFRTQNGLSKQIPPQREKFRLQHTVEEPKVIASISRTLPLMMAFNKESREYS